MALFNVARHQYLAEVVRHSQRGRAIAAFGGINRIGVFLGPALGGAVAAYAGLRVPFLVFGFVGGLALALVLIFVRCTGAAIPEDTPQHGMLATLKEYYRLLSLAGVPQLFMQAIRAGWGIIIPLIGADLLGLDVAAIGAILSAAADVDMSFFFPSFLPSFLPSFRLVDGSLWA